MAISLTDDLRSLAAGSGAGELDLLQAALRVKTGMLVANGEPTSSDMAAFSDLALALVGRIDDQTAEAVARLLATWPHTPDAVRGELFERGGRVAAALVAGAAPIPAGLSLEDLAGNSHVEIARAIAGRADITETVCLDLVARDDAGIDRALAGNMKVELPRACMDVLVDRARHDGACAALLLARPELAQTDVAPLYLFADDTRRAAIRAALAALNNIAATRPGTVLEPGDWQVLLDAASEDAAAALGMLAWRIGGGTTLAATLVRDTTREMAALGLCALGVGVEDATRFLIRLGDEAARSVQRVFAQVDLLRTVRPGVAMRLLVAVSSDAVLRPALAGPQQPGIHVPAMAEGGVNSRGAADRAAPRRTLAGTVDRALRRDQS